MRTSTLALLLGALLGALLAAGAVSPAAAQLGAELNGPVAPVRRDQPVYYQADTANYDRDAGIVTLEGHVDIWQDQRVMMADKVTYDRNTGVAAAYGHVVLLEPDGQTLFSNYAELSGGMRDGVLEGMRALLAANGRLAANGARRIDAHINELTRAIYSTCNLCAKDPTRAPLWDIRAREAVQDTENKMIEYRDAVIEVYGIPVFWTPYLTHPDPSAKRASGLLVPDFGFSKHLGAFLAVPYYWVIDGQSDATFTPEVASRNGPALNIQYRRRFNDGVISIDASAAYLRGDDGQRPGLAGHVFGRGQFAIDDTWRWGVNINRASSLDYLRDFNITGGGGGVLASTLYLEGFGQGAYSRLDASAYQALDTSVIAARLPYVLPRYQYSLVTQPDPLGGRMSVDAGLFNVLRSEGTNTQRARLSLGWNRPATGHLGDVWDFSLHLDSAAYVARGLDQQPNYGPTNAAQSAQAMPTVATRLRWPLVRNTQDWGSQVIEPIVQLIAAPQGSSYVNTRIPNEDSLDDLDFTDASLFALNRFPGIDRLEGGMRANVALHGAWYLPSGGSLDAQVGQGYRAKKETAFPVESGLRDTVTDIVSHVSYTPTAWLDLTSRQRFDHKSQQLRYVDALASAGPSWLRVNAGYLYSTTNPYLLYTQPTTPAGVDMPRNEVNVGFSTKFGPWRLSTAARRDVALGNMVSTGVGASYEDECLIFSVSLNRRYTSINNDHGDTIVLFQITLKTVGEFGFNAL